MPNKSIVCPLCGRKDYKVSVNDVTLEQLESLIKLGRTAKIKIPTKFMHPGIKELVEQCDKEIYAEIVGVRDNNDPYCYDFKVIGNTPADERLLETFDGVFDGDYLIEGLYPYLDYGLPIEFAKPYTFEVLEIERNDLS